MSTKYRVTVQEPVFIYDFVNKSEYLKPEIGSPWEGTVRGERWRGIVTQIDHIKGEATVQLDEEPVRE